jgi:hypothetical protein
MYTVVVFIVIDLYTVMQNILSGFAKLKRSNYNNVFAYQQSTAATVAAAVQYSDIACVRRVHCVQE